LFFFFFFFFFPLITDSREQAEYDQKDSQCKGLEDKQARLQQAATEMGKQIEKLQALYDNHFDYYFFFFSFFFVLLFA
jgi:hypothetical protein